MRMISKSAEKLLAVLLVLAQIVVLPACALETEALETTAAVVSAAKAETAPAGTEPAAVPSAGAAEQVTEAQETQVPAAQEAVETAGESGVPQYFQTDYANHYYAGSTVSAVGSGITALAMVATHLTGHDYTPDVLASYFGDYAGSETERLEYASNALQLPWSKAASWKETIAALERGGIVIASMNDQSVFTGTQQYIVLTGLTGEGNILVNDPYQPNYGKTELEAGFRDGFPQGWISTGYEAGWIYDSGAMPEDPFLYTPQKKEAREMPLYYQTDYPDIRYGSGTIASDGCGITSLAMVATYLTGHTYLPDELADYFGGYTGNNVERLEYASDMLRLPWKEAENWHEAESALAQGDVVIVLENGKSIFTQGQHFIVLTGLTEDGKILVSDTYKPNYDKWDMKEGFKNGFTEGQICAGWSGAWIYDVSAMPANPYIYVEEPTPYVEPRYPGLSLTAADIDLLARMVWVEARGEVFDGQQAVAEVVLNRVVANDFQSTVQNVVYAPGQFRSTQFLDEAEPTQTQYEAVEQALYGPYVLPIDVVHFAQYPVNENVWGTIGGHVFCYQWSEDDLGNSE